MTDKLIPLTWTNTSIKEKNEREIGKRESGLYWVKFKNYEGDWSVAEYQGTNWLVIGCEMTWGDGDFSQIGPRVDFPMKERYDNLNED